MKQTIIPAAAIRATVDAMEGKSITAKAAALGMTRQQLYNYLRDGVQVDLSQAARNMLEAAGVEIVTAKKRSK